MRLAWVLVVVMGCRIDRVEFVSERDDGGVDTAPPAMPGDYRWVRSLSSMNPTGLAEGPGGLVVTGYFNAPVDLGGGPLTPGGEYDALIAGLAGDGAHLFSVRHGGAGSEFPFLDVAAGNGEPIVHGVSYGAVDLGQGPVQGGGGPGADGFIGLYGAGVPSWVKRIVGPGEDKIVATALGPDGTVYGAGWFEGTTSFDGGALTSAGGRDIFLARFDTATGGVDLKRRYGSASRDEASSIAFAGTSLVLAGMFSGTLALGSPAPPLTSAGLLDVYVAKLNLVGTPEWAVRFGAAGEDRDPYVAVDAAGDIYVTGHFHGTVAFGAFDLTSKGGADVFVARLRGLDGTVAWATSFGAVGDDSVRDIAVDGQGRVAVGATLAGPLDGSPSTAGLDAAIFSLDGSTGALQWSHIYSTPGDDRAWLVGYGRDGDVYAGIALGGPFDFGQPILGAPDPVGVLMRMAP